CWEDTPMQRTVALRARGRLAALLNSILRAARRRGTWQEPDARNLRTWRQLVLGVLVQRSTRLLSLARAVLPARQASRVETAAAGQPKPPAAKPATTFGYVDVWAGLVLRGQPFLPLTRQLFSAAHPQLPSQPTVEDAVLERALALLRGLPLPCIAVGDRGLG